ncbi:MAG: Hef nuclease, partial [Nanoarchaeota archaeon]|nr:Hef nuclease [Nanoarchaeota archaeon]
IVLVAKGTRDEAYRWVSFRKEKKMLEILASLKSKFIPQRREPKQSELIIPEEVVVYADHREKGSGIIKKLIDIGLKVELKQLEVGDFLLSPRLVVEHKLISDFVDSMIDRRLFTQLKEMQKYEKRLIILEGAEDLYSQRNLPPNAIRGMLSVIAVDYAIPIIRTKDSEDTALVMAIIAKREQAKDSSSFTMHSAKPDSIREQQEYVVSSLPGVGSGLAKPLLKHFSSIKKIVNATEDELREVDLIGEKKARKIRDLLDSEYFDL